MSFNETWTEALLDGDNDGMDQVDDKINQLASAIRERVAVQHNAYASETGETDVWEHKAGECNVIYVGLKANFPTPSTSNSGCSAVATDEGNNVYYWSGSAWTELGALMVGGMIVMWSGTIATIPTGWALCNGANGTPDLRDKFIVCAKEDDGGSAKTNITGSLSVSGGSTTHNHGGATDSHTLTTDEIPSHTHPERVDGRDRDTDTNGTRVSGAVDYRGSLATSTATTGSTGGGQGHTHDITSASNLGPYYALAYIMKT